MTSISRLLSISTISLLLVLAGCAGTRTDRSTGEYIDDAAITTKVKTALIDNSSTKARQIDVETYRGKVQLNGFVDSETAKTKAAQIAESVKGVKSVENNLVVSAQSSSPGEYIDDAKITTKVKTALYTNGDTNANQINVETKNAVVQLSGWVDSWKEKTTAGEVARSVAGVKEVDNELDVRR